ncbi:UDP-N-acetylmuramoyl-L-alanyl-D-glutamate--2, 6-diaminopimelate ligase [Quillaja saponaria]|uniref:UDP-N-acetylmuramoyl-L-alanyl-D-glutamate--2, 6-diaminopimelate ligase n=1 Tax=Quillaja saponaria TaxID=32244 RepID=A0AAD7P788_QUISA|nr:UDP-N-acetylmuramoyl-L-alanyl-D-glutamate--2, 6-diaminopimelate ligase [Quillaja saponaria]
MSDREDNDSDAPEEFTSEQGIQQDEEIRKVQNESKARVIREGKERRRQWAQKITPRKSKKSESLQGVSETETQQQSDASKGMLPDDIVKMLASREKQVFSSDSEDEEAVVKRTSRKKKPKCSGLGPVILSDMGPPQCLQSSLEFLKKKKMEISRSSSVLNNSNQALRLLSASGLLNRK